jgi:hypothetical protein
MPRKHSQGDTPAALARYEAEVQTEPRGRPPHNKEQ